MTDIYKLELIATGSFIDRETDPESTYRVTVSTYRMSSSAMTSWICFAAETDVQEYANETAEAMVRTYLGIPQNERGWSFTQNEIRDILTVVHIVEENKPVKHDIVEDEGWMFDET